MGGEGDDLPRVVALHRVQVLQQGVPVAAGELDVEQHQLGSRLVGAEQLHEPIATRQREHLVALQGEQGTQQFQVVGLILDDHDRSHRSLRPTAAA